ncbi:TPA: protein Eaa, partial [Salmonella enterica subsp. enterica serovar Haifa]|nr:protein Eaa [Salmonella enterica subsp. enterica serovar Haifa]
MAKDIAFKLGAVLNDEEAEIFADGYNAAML